jgi:hypothetical protein
LNLYDQQKITSQTSFLLGITENSLKDIDSEIYVSGDGCPIKILHGILFGASTFEASLPFTLAEKKRAFNFIPKL